MRLRCQNTLLRPLERCLILLLTPTRYIILKKQYRIFRCFFYCEIFYHRKVLSIDMIIICMIIFGTGISLGESHIFIIIVFSKMFESLGNAMQCYMCNSFMHPPRTSCEQQKDYHNMDCGAKKQILHETERHTDYPKQVVNRCSTDHTR